MSLYQCGFGDDQGKDVTVPKAEGPPFPNDYRLLHTAGVRY